jgi:phage terminase small subunit
MSKEITKPRSEEVTEKQKRFCEEYLIDLNGTQAAIRAGYSTTSAHSTASEILSYPNIQDYLSQRQKELQEATGVTQKRILEEYAKIAFFDIRNIYDEQGRLLTPNQLGDEAAAVISGIDVFEEKEFDGRQMIPIGETKKVKLHSKLNALDALGKHLGVFKKDNDQKQTSVVITGMNIV